MRATAYAVGLWMGFVCVAADACDLPAPKESPDLTITGAISKCTVTGEVLFDESLFATLPRTKIETENPWESAKVEYEGPLLADVLKFAGAEGSTITINALNDYHAEVSVADLVKYGVVLADRKNGQPMPISEMGPYFVIFPFDAFPELKTEERYGQSVWQVQQIVVNP